MTHPLLRAAAARFLLGSSWMLLVSCRTAAVDPPAASAGEVAQPVSAQPLPPAPSSVDLRPTFMALGLAPRPQGARGTCSIFTTCSAIEFALAKQTGRAVRLSPEYLNWAGAKAINQPSDGNFFHNALKGWEQDGLCAEVLMPYAGAYDPARNPSQEARAEAHAIRDQARESLVVHWIVPWEPDRFGVSDAQFAEIKATLAHGDPIAAGSAHSRLLVGYRDDPELPGGGVFLTLDSALNRFDEVTYEFVRRDVADVFWIECVAPSGDH